MPCKDKQSALFSVTGCVMWAQTTVRLKWSRAPRYLYALRRNPTSLSMCTFQTCVPIHYVSAERRLAHYDIHNIFHPRSNQGWCKHIEEYRSHPERNSPLKAFNFFIVCWPSDLPSIRNINTFLGTMTLHVLPFKAHDSFNSERTLVLMNVSKFFRSCKKMETFTFSGIPVQLFSTNRSTRH